VRKISKTARFIQLDIQNYAGVRQKSVTYGDLTRLSGKNGEGKSSIGGAPVWGLWGVDLFGGKYDPSPTTYEFDVVRVVLLLEVDKAQYKFERGIDGGDTIYLLNDVPVKATEYKRAVDALFDKDEFLSLYHPAYFFTQHWTKQREQVMRYTTAPAKSEVFAEMSRTSPDQKAKDIKLNPAATKLDELSKQHNLDDLTKIHGGTGGKKSKLEKHLIAAQSRFKTLKEQLDRLPASEDLTALMANFDAMQTKIDAHDSQCAETRDEAEKLLLTRRELTANLNSVNAEIDQRKRQWKVLSGEEIDTHCKVCKQSLDEDAVKATTDDKDRRITVFKVGNKAVLDKRAELLEKIAELPELPDTEEMDRVAHQQREQRTQLQRSIHEQERRTTLAAEVDRAKADESQTHTDLKESIFILDAIKAYRAKEAELQAAKVQSLFTRLSVRLFKYVKSKDEYEPDFSIQMDGKDYVQLSKGEKVTAELELTEVLFKQSEMITPLFLDNEESYTGGKKVYGQLIEATVVKGQELKVETEDAI